MAFVLKLGVFLSYVRRLTTYRSIIEQNGTLPTGHLFVDGICVCDIWH